MKRIIGLPIKLHEQCNTAAQWKISSVCSLEKYPVYFGHILQYSLKAEPLKCNPLSLLWFHFKSLLCPNNLTLLRLIPIKANGNYLDRQIKKWK